ncbi:hypothetical protein CFC21_059810 [Triticum aestivum]|uniref:Inositol-pentakisphosphate 2-kinase n=2 Tax=Triticum aestivum TaxID=4565 RepID=A0A3B6J0F1_WHEAT|nr:hypothetical protein CFC21_059810 [Triticum aestivum]
MRPQPSSACPPAQAAPATSGSCPPWHPAPAAPRSFTSAACRSSYTASSFVVRVTTRLGLGAAPPLDLHATAGSRPSPIFRVDMEVALQACDAADWVYKGEGAANLILSYTGSSPSMLGKVMRAKKVLNDKAQPAPNYVNFSSYEQLMWGDIPELIESVKQGSVAQAYAAVFRELCNMLDPGKPVFNPKKGKPSVFMSWFKRPIIYDVRARPNLVESTSGSRDLQMPAMGLTLCSYAF